MQVITTTQLRTKSKQLIKTLEEGYSVDLIHRSKVVGEIKPKDEPKVLTLKDIKQIEKIADELNLPKTTYAQREKNYRKHIMDKYGKGLS
jgi:hypothetical protein